MSELRQNVQDAFAECNRLRERVEALRQLPEIEQVITDILVAVDQVDPRELDGPTVDALRAAVEHELRTYYGDLYSLLSNQPEERQDAYAGTCERCGKAWEGAHDESECLP